MSSAVGGWPSPPTSAAKLSKIMASVWSEGATFSGFFFVFDRGEVGEAIAVFVAELGQQQ